MGVFLLSFRLLLKTTFSILLCTGDRFQRGQWHETSHIAHSGSMPLSNSKCITWECYYEMLSKCSNFHCFVFCKSNEIKGSK